MASVGEQLVTDSEARLEAVISALDASPSPFWDRDGRPPLDRLIDAAVVRELAGDVALYQPAGDALAARLEAVRSLFPDRSAWERFLDSWGLDEDGLRTLIVRRMVVERYLARNVQVPADDRAAWWDAYEAVMSQQRPRFRIRVVPPISESR